MIDGHPVRTGLSGLYQVYNILAVWSALSEAGRRETAAVAIQEHISRYHTQFGRGEEFIIRGRRVVLNLAKNPAGFNQNIAAVLEDKAPKNLIIVINDNDQDGTDISWLWDVDFDKLTDDSVRSITVSGIRALDLVLRFKYVGIPVKVEESSKSVLESGLEEGSDPLYVLVNYTALFAIHQMLKRKVSV